MEQVDEAGGNIMSEVTIAVVEAILEPLRPALTAMRAKVEVGLILSISHFHVWDRSCISSTATTTGIVKKLSVSHNFVPRNTIKQVLSAADGDVKLSFNGHRKVAYGVEMALLDNPLIRNVVVKYVDWSIWYSNMYVW